MEKLVAGVELGGTKAIVVRGRGSMITDCETFPTTTPAETLGACLSVLSQWNEEQPLDAFGIASFGPVRVDPTASDYGHILRTPKQGWSNFDVLGVLANDLDCPAAIDTDVNGAALAECAYGAGRGCRSLVYLTIGTGLGGGILFDGKPIVGALHPEIGHLRLKRSRDDVFAGNCPFHGDCVEGLVSGPALAARFGIDPAQVAADDPRWEFVASDLAQLFATLLLTLSCDRILVGGGVATNRPELIAHARSMVPQLLAGYLPDLDEATIRERIRRPELANRAGPVGALMVAERALA
ncbi:ROK family protein [Parerythrobacter aestuarii]|uniref:ROK family protein n=1 Tax=Parerythrobacter aestuarii TaxID=3020909 RepID=UPI0024DE518A|nr:ROK family protein [Parerythrobacter aestuarii]